jgi:hypothetical protein
VSADGSLLVLPPWLQAVSRALVAGMDRVETRNPRLNGQDALHCHATASRPGTPLKSIDLPFNLNCLIVLWLVAVSRGVDVVLTVDSARWNIRSRSIPHC